MLFTDWIFWIFLPTVLGLHAVLPNHFRKTLLVCASYLLCGWYDWRAAVLLFGATVLTYGIGRAIASADDPGRRKRRLAVGLFLILGVLASFKYLHFFAASVNVILPIGISFYFFQAMSYVIDIYKRDVEPAGSFLDFALYLSFFPKLMAGPIERPNRFLSQLLEKRRPDFDRFTSGIWLILVGLFRKIAIADSIGPTTASIFTSPSQEHPLVLLAGLCLFSIQIYCDFAGYTAIARGSARLLGFELSENFRLPYLARNITEFWRRWHITLSQWFRDYVFFPLGGIQKGRIREYANVFLTMALVGLWHGASWNFVAWGSLHGLALVLHRWMARDSSISWIHRIPAVASWALTFSYVSLCWIFFKTPDWATAFQYIDHLFLWQWTLLFPTYRVASTAYTLGLALAALLFVDLGPMAHRRDDAAARWRPAWAGLYLGGLLLGLCLLAPSANLPFIYFRF